ncbi:hypothetical protein PanWU01x14_026850 [Parasponia andersonii]|uniref:Uncharacterized protein n=1 Tax=Parasponia andersonii TaxID=3476 RepID=A0A2P5DW62_PARAD|nr:hypothetical protein PanWU01x14_026850 [Parasponia andersonii]
MRFELRKRVYDHTLSGFSNPFNKSKKYVRGRLVQHHRGNNTRWDRVCETRHPQLTTISVIIGQLVPQINMHVPFFAESLKMKIEAKPPCWGWPKHVRRNPELVSHVCHFCPRHVDYKPGQPTRTIIGLEKIGDGVFNVTFVVFDKQIDEDKGVGFRRVDLVLRLRDVEELDAFGEGVRSDERIGVGCEVRVPRKLHDQHCDGKTSVSSDKELRQLKHGCDVASSRMGNENKLCYFLHFGLRCF